MQHDEAEIRALVAHWLTASEAGDTQAVLAMMTEDAVFLVPGQTPMSKAGFAAASQAQTATGAPKVAGQSDIEEIIVAGDWAFMRSKLRMTITPANGSPTVVRSGYTLTVLKKEAGQWKLARDANLLTVEKPATK